MNMVPYPTRERRLEKTVRHYFAPHERWWELSGEDFWGPWLTAWNLLRGADVFNGAEGWLRILPGTREDEIAADAHGRWLATANAAVNHAVERNTVFPSYGRDRVCYVGPGGITVIVHHRQGVAHLVTAYRMVPVWSPGPTGFPDCDRAALERARARQHMVMRAAVRCRVRQASFGEDVRDPAVEEHA